MKATLLVLAALALPACIHTWETREGPTDEQKLELYSTTATYLYESDDLYRAQEQAVKALEIDPENLVMRRMIGWIRLRLGSNEDLIVAERFFRDLLRDKDENSATILGLSIACERLGTAYDRSARATEDGRRTPNAGREVEADAAALRETAATYWQEAAERLEGLLAEGEGSTDAMNALQRIYAEQGRLEESLAWSERLLERAEEELEIRRRMLTSTNLSQREEKVFRENVSKAQELSIQTHLFAATLLFKLAREKEALGHLDDVVEESPNMAQVYGMRAQLRHRLGLFELAIEDIDRFLSLSEEPFEHPDIRRAFDLRDACARELVAQSRG